MAQPEDYDAEGWVRHYAHRLNARCWRWPWLRPFYDIMSDALIWPDEVLWLAPHQVGWALRPLRFYRTGLIIGEPQRGREYWEYWELCQKLFPCWVGFHPTRCRPVRKHIAIYRAGNINMIRCLKEMDDTDIPIFK